MKLKPNPHVARALVEKALRGKSSILRKDASRSESVMSDPSIYESTDPIAAVHIDERQSKSEGWASRLVLFIRAIAALSMVKGLYHWAVICGFGAPSGVGFEAQSSSWQIATVFFAVIDLVAAVGLWLGAPWGIIIWLASSATMIVVHVLLPQIYGFQPLIIVAEIALIGGYVFIAYKAAREQPENG